MFAVDAVHEGAQEWADRTASLSQVGAVRASVTLAGAQPVEVEATGTAPTALGRRGLWGRRTESPRPTSLRLRRRVRGTDGSTVGDVEVHLDMLGEGDLQLLGEIVTDGLVAVVRMRLSDGVERRRDDHLNGVIREGDLSAATRDALLEESVVPVGLVSVELASLGRFTRVNHRLQRLSGRAADALVGTSYLQLLDQPQRAQQESGLRRAVGGRRVPLRSEGRLLVPGVVAGPWVRVTVTPVLDVLDHPVLATVQIQRVDGDEPQGSPALPTSRPMGLLDPAGFAEVVDEARDRATRTDRSAAMYTARIEGWDALVEQIGAEAAQDAVRHVAARLRGTLRSDDAIGLVGSHEIAFLAEEIDPDQAVALAQRMTASVGSQFESGGRSVPLEIGLGVAMVDPRSPTPVLLDRSRAARGAWHQVATGPAPTAPGGLVPSPLLDAPDVSDASPTAPDGGVTLPEHAPRYYSNRRKPSRHDQPATDGWRRARR